MEQAKPEGESAVVLLSGGMDSTVALAIALQECEAGVHALSFKYGSRHNAVEYKAAQAVVKWYQELGFQITHQLVELPDIFVGGGRSALMGDIDMPHQSYDELHAVDGESPTVVPFRNGVLLSIAAAVAEVRQYGWVYSGAHGEDAHRWAYPDCAPEFNGSIGAAIYVGTYHRVRLKVPFQYMFKDGVCGGGLALKAPLHLTWSCYAPAVWGTTPDGEIIHVHCGKCPTCIERIQAFKNSGVIDPVEYAVDVDWEDCISYEMLNIARTAPTEE